MEEGRGQGLEKRCCPLSGTEQGQGWHGERGNVSAGFSLCFQRKNPALQREMSAVPARRDAPGFELGPGIFPGSSLVTPARPALPGGFALGAVQGDDGAMVVGAGQ